MTVKLWDVATGVEQATLRGHDHGIRGLAFSPDDRTLVTGSMDTTVRLWDVAGHTEKMTLEEPRMRSSALRFRPMASWSPLAIRMTP